MCIFFEYMYIDAPITIYFDEIGRKMCTKTWLLLPLLYLSYFCTFFSVGFGTGMVIYNKFFPASCQGRDWIFVIWSDYHASADSLCPPHSWINGVISLTDTLCVHCRQIGQLVPRWQLYRYGGDWRWAQGRAADSSWCLLEVPSLHWSSHVPEV